MDYNGIYGKFISINWSRIEFMGVQLNSTFLVSHSGRDGSLKSWGDGDRSCLTYLKSKMDRSMTKGCLQLLT
jgi:hypothetical protein